MPNAINCQVAALAEIWRKRLFDTHGPLISQCVLKVLRTMPIKATPRPGSEAEEDEHEASRSCDVVTSYLIIKNNEFFIVIEAIDVWTCCKCSRTNRTSEQFCALCGCPQCRYAHCMACGELRQCFQGVCFGCGFTKRSPDQQWLRARCQKCASEKVCVLGRCLDCSEH